MVYDNKRTPRNAKLASMILLQLNVFKRSKFTFAINFFFGKWTQEVIVVLNYPS